MAKSIIPTFLLLSSITSAQTILDAAALPACALSCPILVQAQAACLPPTVPVGSQQSYNTCYCNSDFLVNLKAGKTAGLCNGYCTAAQMEPVRGWFQDYICQGQVNNAAATTVVTMTAGSPTGTSTSAASANGSKSDGSKQPTWISEHYQWIIMVIVLILAAIIATVVGVWFKRRHRAKKNALLGTPHHRSSILIANEAAHSLRSKHPVTTNTPAVGAGAAASMSQLPRHTSRNSLRRAADAGRFVPRSNTTSGAHPLRDPSGSNFMGGAAGVGSQPQRPHTAAAAAAAAAAYNMRSPQRFPSTNEGGGLAELKGKGPADITPSTMPSASGTPQGDSPEGPDMMRRSSTRLQKRPPSRTETKSP